MCLFLGWEGRYCMWRAACMWEGGRSVVCWWGGHLSHRDVRRMWVEGGCRLVLAASFVG